MYVFFGDLWVADGCGRLSPGERIAEAFVVGHGLVDREFWVLHLVEAFFRYFRHP